MNESISGQKIADYLKMNRSYLCQRYKTETGISLGKQIQNMKIGEAKRLLSSGEYSIIDVAVMLDYSSQSTFQTIFKKSTGITPKSWQQLHTVRTN